MKTIKRVGKWITDYFEPTLSSHPCREDPPVLVELDDLLLAWFGAVDPHLLIAAGHHAPRLDDLLLRHTTDHELVAVGVLDTFGVWLGRVFRPRGINDRGARRKRLVFLTTTCAIRLKSAQNGSWISKSSFAYTASAQSSRGGGLFQRFRPC